MDIKFICMNLRTISLLAAILAFLVSCGGGASTETVKTEAPKEEAKPTASNEHYKVNVEESELGWKGEKAIGDSHSGVAKISEGELHVENHMITAGKFVVDMNSLEEPDNDNEEYAAKLIKHLKSADFFDVAKFSTATFTITGVEEKANEESGDTHLVKGNLVLKGIEKGIEFPASITMEDGVLNASAEFTIDRTQWEIKFMSGLAGAVGDKIIKDEFTFNVSIVANKAGA